MKAAIWTVVCALVVGAIINVSHLPEHIWLESSYMMPQETERFVAPFPVIRCNPFGIFGSATGRTVSNWLSDSANRSEHLGAGTMSSVPYRFAPASWMRGLLKGIAMHNHVHASEGRHHHDDDDDDDHDHHHDGLVTQAEKEWAIHKRDTLLKTAYLLDPGNYVALQAMIYVCEGKGGGKTDMVLDGVNFQVPDSIVENLQLCRFSLAHYDLGAVWWPEHSLYAAKTLETIWLLYGQIEKSVEGSTWSVSSRKQLEALRTDVAKLVTTAEAQQAILSEAGIWQLRSVEQRIAFGMMLDEEKGFLAEVEKAITQRKDTD